VPAPVPAHRVATDREASVELVDRLNTDAAEVGEDRGGDVPTDLDDPRATEHLRLTPGGIRSRRMLSGHESPLRPMAWRQVPSSPGRRRDPDRHGRDRPA